MDDNLKLKWLPDALRLMATHGDPEVSGRQIHSFKATHFSDCASHEGKEYDCVPDVEYVVRYKGSAPAADTADEEDCG